MSKNTFAVILGLVLSLVGRTADAFIDPPYLSPEHPVVDEMVSVKIRSGMCDAIFGEAAQVTREGNAVRILLWSVSYHDSELCYITPGTGTYAVGAFPAGSYTLQVDRFYGDILGGTVYETLGVIPFTVTGGTSQPVSAPALGKTGLGVLMLSFLGFAVSALRSRRSDLLLVALCILPLSAHAQDAPRNRVIELLLTTTPGTSTAENVVAQREHLADSSTNFRISDSTA